MSTPTLLQSIHELLERYDLFVLDQWGVLHDGAQGRDAARSALLVAASAGARTAVCTNSGKSVHYNADRLIQFGFPKSFFDVIISSGELAANHILTYDEGNTLYWIDYVKDPWIREKLSKYEIVDDIADADILFLTGWQSTIMSWERLQSSLESAALRNLPMVCGNPDLVGFRDGVIQKGPGAVAELYLGLGGEVRSFGKPDKEIFHVCIEAVEAASNQTTVVIGDSFVTDICGAFNAGMDSVLIIDGIHRARFNDADWREVVLSLSREYSDGSALPTYFMKELR